MESQGTSESEIYLDFACFPDVPFLQVLSYLSGPQIEKCRGISRLFRARIDMNRKSLPSVQVDYLSIGQVESDNAISANDHEEMETISLFMIWEGDLLTRELTVHNGVCGPVKKIFERLDHLLPRMSIKSLNLWACSFDDRIFRELLGKFKDLNIKCEDFRVDSFEAKQGQTLPLDDLRSMILLLKPKHLSYMVLRENIPFTSAFWQEKFIRDCPSLSVRGPLAFFDDQVLLNLTQSSAYIGFVTACTLDGIVSFLKEWKAGTREVTMILLGVRPTSLVPKAFLARLPWNDINQDYHPDTDAYFADIVNSLGKKITLSISHLRRFGTFLFLMRNYATRGLEWLDPKFYD